MSTVIDVLQQLSLAKELMICSGPEGFSLAEEKLLSSLSALRQGIEDGALSGEQAGLIAEQCAQLSALAESAGSLLGGLIQDLAIRQGGYGRSGTPIVRSGEHTSGTQLTSCHY